MNLVNYLDYLNYNRDKDLEVQLKLHLSKTSNEK